MHPHIFACSAVWCCCPGLSRLAHLDVGGSEALLVTQPFCDMVSWLTQLSVRCNCLARLQDGELEAEVVNFHTAYSLSCILLYLET